ncbi:MAG TPA: TonB-dependent receptor plug domain-containing protein [Bacteroidales bacterium]|nr:TonB-dependent receptor plug domain-containing protein [Bacteroidales bacterium]
MHFTHFRKRLLNMLILVPAFYTGNHLAAQNYKIYPDSLNVTNEITVSDFLQGRVSGLDIIASSGDPGRNAQMILRGLSHNGINTPLIVIDGIPWWSPEQIDRPFVPASEEPRCLIPVSLKDIASIEILKDGSAVSQFGAEGANGAILIETKKGGPQKMHLSYQFNQSLVQKPSYMPMLSGDEYIMYQLEAWHNAEGVFEIPPEISYDRDYSGFYNYSANTDWVKAVTQRGAATNHFLNISGGNKKSRYYGSMNFLDQKGSLINSGYNRFLGRMFYERYFTDKLTASLQLSNAFNKYDVNVSMYDMDILEMAFIKAPNMSIWEYDSSGNRTGDYFVPSQNYQGPGLSYFNPVAVSELGNSGNKQNDFMATVRLHYALTGWLRFAEIFTWLRSSADYSNYLPRKAIFNDSEPFDVINSHFDQFSKQYRNEVQALFKIPFKNEERNELSGTLSYINQYMINKTGYNPPFDDKHDYSRNSVSSSLMYRYQNRYMLNVNTRIESLYNDQDIWDKHFGISAGWRFSDEPFLKALHLPEAMIYSGLSYADYFPFRFYQMISTWHQTPVHVRTFNSGIHLGTFSNRVRFTAEFYSKFYSQDIIETGFVAESKSRSRGWEVMIDDELIKTRNVKWQVNVNLAHNNSQYVKVPEIMTTGMLENGKFLGRIDDNTPRSEIYGLKYEGLYATGDDVIAHDRNGDIIYNNLGEPGINRYDYRGNHKNFQAGDVKYKDLNYDGIINENDVVYLGNSYPKFTGGFGSTVKYKNLSLTGNFHFRSGYKVMRLAALESEGMVSLNNQSREVINRWKVEGQGTDLIHRAYKGHPANNLGSDRYVANGGFLRLNYVSLGYNLNPRICQYLHLSEISLNMSAQRLFTISGYDGVDPEIEMESNGWHQDVIRAYPPKIYTFSIEVRL